MFYKICIKLHLNRLTVFRYYEAQPIESQQIYDIVLPHYEEISNMHIREEEEENEGYDEIDKESTEEEQYETPHNYIEMV